MLPLILLFQAAVLPVPAGEQPVDPYVQSDANAGAKPFEGLGMWHAFHEQAGLDRIVDGFVRRNTTDPRIKDVFAGQDYVRLRRVLKEQFCYILGGGCAYSGRDMKEAHKNMGVQATDFGAVVENLQKSMADEHVPVAAQNRFLAKLAPMKKDVVER